MKNLAIIVFLTFLITSCSTPESEDYQNLEKVQYEMADDHFVTVILDPNLEPKSHNFKFLDAQDDFLLELEKSTTITVNKKMYEDLSHYFDPYQISILDKDYSIRIGENVFKATKEAVYTKSKNTSNWKLDFYYGLSGKESLKETELVYKNSLDLSKLKNHKFKCPDAKNLYKRKSKEFAKGVKAQDYFNYSNPNGSFKTVKYKETFNGPTYTANIRWRCWNEGYRKWGRKAKGGTITEINRSNRGWRSMDNNEKMGRYLVTGEFDESFGYVRVEVKSHKTKSKSGNRFVSVDKVNRKKKTKTTTSTHNGSIRDNETGERNELMRNHKVVTKH